MVEETLARIEAAIRRARAADPKEREELIRLLETLKAELRAGRGGEGGLAAARAALEKSIAEYETAHPQLAAAVNDICTRLASIGI